MMTKYERISILAEDTAKEIVRNAQAWTKYLDTAARLYKYPFNEQMLIYAQRPDASACASIETWNNKMFCWVNRRAKGIALIDTQSRRPKLKYVFDRSDVHRLKQSGRDPYLWELREETKEPVLMRLEAVYGNTDEKQPFEDRIVELAERIALENYEELLLEARYVTDGSFLEGLDELNIGVRLRDTLSASIAYTILSRCGADMEKWREELNFDHISEFNTVRILSILGNATTEMCKPLLMEIGQVIRAYERQNGRNQAEQSGVGNNSQNHQQNIGKGIENRAEREYNALKRESKKRDKIVSKAEIEKETEGILYEADIREKRRISDTEPSSQRGTGRGTDQVRTDAGELPERASGRHLPGNGPDRRTENTLPGGTGAGREEDGSFDRTDGESRGSDRKAEGERSVRLGGKDEQYQAFSGRDRAGGIDLRIDSGKEFNTETWEPDSEENSLSGFSLVKGRAADQNKTKEIYEQLDFFTMFTEQRTNVTERQREVDSTKLAVPENATDVKSVQLPKDISKSAVEMLSGRPALQVDKQRAVNFHILGDNFASGGIRDKFKRNIEAIRTLEKIEREERTATPEEQQILSRYVGWGGLADAFDESNSSWSAEYQELKGLLSPAEYALARESTLNAHYTSPVVIRSIYDALDKMGFYQGNILEPSMGIGNFFGMLPEKMQDSRLYGVELDEITGRIARQLYPEADIRITGFEKTDFPDDFFDIVVGNVPFGNYKVLDKRYDRHNFLIHDYFFAKSIDKVRQGGVIAMITTNGMSGGTFDKRDSRARKYIAQRCDLLGAIRLPSGTFEDADLPTDILFFQKREHKRDLTTDLPDWVQTTIIHESDHVKENGEVRHNIVSLNNYFLAHPEMILGKQEIVNGPFGPKLVCLPTEGGLKEKLKDAVGRLQGEIIHTELDDLEEEISRTAIPADPDVKNYSFCLMDDRVYYRENSIMKPVELSDSMLARIRGMVSVRNCTQELIELQMEEYPDAVIREKQAELNSLYDTFTKKYGLISSRMNKRAFNQDSSYCLLCSLEKLDDEGNFKGKADMFSKRTIKKAEVVTRVDTSSEALAVSLSEKAGINLMYMAELTGKDTDTITTELAGIIFHDHETGRWETLDEYLSGNVREKLEKVKAYAEEHPEYAVNVQALTQVQPKELEASEIEVRIGATWIEPHYIEDFMRDIFETPEQLFSNKKAGIQYTDITGQWNVKGKNEDQGNSLVTMTYGTSRRNAYTILEDSLNLRDSRVYDIVVEDGVEKRVLNKRETMIASQKQETIRQAFQEWIFRDPERRQVLTAKYNRIFNSTRPREYDGSHLKFPGMSPDIELKPHQKNAVAHVLYGNNTLLAHCVGAGKTFEMTAAAMESKRLGLCQKSMFVVPNHLTGQWASDFLRLYPGANILAATKKDFEPANRKKFCSRIATGDYDAVIIGHSQFEKIPLSMERQTAIIERQIEEIETAIEQVKAAKGERYTIKQMEKTRKGLNVKLDKLHDTSRKDDVVTFEQLGVDRLFVDESHNYKNMFFYTKMRNVAGIAQTEAQKSSDMFAKCQYMDEITGGRGITFATGTPISNSMTELYTNMRYLQYNTLERLGLGHFDSWASSFGETVTAVELSPEGTGYRAKTRFARFFNLPELIALFKESADIQTADMLDLPIPEAEYENVTLEPSSFQKEMVASLAERAEQIRNGMVDSSVDNMLKITTTGRKLALDQRLINALLPGDEHSKTTICVEKAFQIWEKTMAQRSAQLIFSDLGTPKVDGSFNVYADIREMLIKKGVPEAEIAFIHDANTDSKKTALFSKVRSGKVRFLLGSTQKMGAGTNVQDRLIALHHLDVPWRPSDIEQREGRILRQFNLNEKVKIFRYVTEGTFDCYSWQVLENKQKFISQIMSSKSPVRSCEDIDETSLTYAEVKALATGNPYIREKMELDVQVSKLRLMKANHTSQKYRLEDNIISKYPQQINAIKLQIECLQADMETYRINKPAEKDDFTIIVEDQIYTDKKEAGAVLLDACRKKAIYNEHNKVGEYLGFRMEVTFDFLRNKVLMDLIGKAAHRVEIGEDLFGNFTRINNALEGLTKRAQEMQEQLATAERQLENAKVELERPFEQEQELAEKLERLAELNALLNMEEKGNDAVAMDEEDSASGKAEAEISSETDKHESVYPESSLRKKMEHIKSEIENVSADRTEMPDSVQVKKEDDISGEKGTESKGAKSTGLADRCSIKDKLTVISGGLKKTDISGQKEEMVRDDREITFC